MKEAPSLTTPPSNQEMKAQCPSYKLTIFWFQLLVLNLLCSSFFFSCHHTGVQVLINLRTKYPQKHLALQLLGFKSTPKLPVFYDLTSCSSLASLLTRSTHTHPSLFPSYSGSIAALNSTTLLMQSCPPDLTHLY